MNCPLHLKEMADPKRVEKEKEEIRREEWEFIMAGPFVREDYIS